METFANYEYDIFLVKVLLPFLKLETYKERMKVFQSPPPQDTVAQ